MTLNDAIIDYEKMAKHQEWLKKQNTNHGGTEYIKMSCLNDKKAQEYFQLAEWLKELKELRGKYARLRRECNEVIDEICRLREAEDDRR